MSEGEMNERTVGASGSAGTEPPPDVPAPPANDEPPGPLGQVVAGLVLVVLGVALFLLERLDASADHLFLILGGGIFTSVYFHRRAYGFLIPGGLLTGLGSGLAVEELNPGSFSDVDGALGLGVGFLLIYVLSAVWERVNRWWPLIPGGVLVLAGLPYWARADELFEYWPVLVMLIGLVVLVRAVASRQATR